MAREERISEALAVWPHELADSPEARVALIQKMERVLRHWQRMGVAGHWAYNVSDHRALLRVYEQELADLPTTGARS